MDEVESVEQDLKIVAEALKALKEASLRTVAAGLDQVVVVGDELVQTGPAGTHVLKRLPPRRTVTETVKQARR